MTAGVSAAKAAAVGLASAAWQTSPLATAGAAGALTITVANAAVNKIKSMMPAPTRVGSRYAAALAAQFHSQLDTKCTSYHSVDIIANYVASIVAPAVAAALTSTEASGRPHLSRAMYGRWVRGARNLFL